MKVELVWLNRVGLVIIGYGVCSKARSKKSDFVTCLYSQLLTLKSTIILHAAYFWLTNLSSTLEQSQAVTSHVSEGP